MKCKLCFKNLFALGHPMGQQLFNTASIILNTARVVQNVRVIAIVNPCYNWANKTTIQLTVYQKQATFHTALLRPQFLLWLYPLFWLSDELTELIENASELLNAINPEETQVAIYSNGDERLHRVLEELRISHFFNFILTSAETGLQKPRPEAFIRMLKIANITDYSEGKF